MLSFVWLDDRESGPIAELDDDDLATLQQELLTLKARAGVCLDPYSDTRLAPNHAKLLLEAMAKNPHISRNIEGFVTRLGECIRSDRWMLAVGD
jgi:hypothetical protein